MTNNEFSDQFDILLNSYSTIEPKGLTQDISNIKLDEYEKSVYLTNAQEDLLIQIASTSFEANEEFRRTLNNLIKNYSTTTKVTSNENIGENTVFFPIPSNTMKILKEDIITSSTITCFNNLRLKVVPITHDEYMLQKDNPFRKPKMTGRTRQTWRIDYGDILGSKVVEIAHPEEIDIYSYNMRYIPKPSPIILVDLPNDLSIDGINVETECELDSLLHREILKLAVTNALRVIVGTRSSE